MRRRGLGAALAVAVCVLWSCTVVRTGLESDPPQPDTGAPPQEVAAFHLVADGRQQLAGGRTETAIATFQKALALAPSSPHANLALAEAKVRQGAFRAALVYCDRVVRLVGDDPAWRPKLALTRGHAFEGMGDAVRAAEEFRRVLDADPGNQQAREALIRLESAAQTP